GLHWKDGDVSVDQSPAWDVPSVVVVVDVETTKRYENLTETDGKRIAELELAPHLLDRHFAAIAAFEVLRERGARGRPRRRLLDFDFGKALELDLDVRLESIVWRGVGGQHEAPEVESGRLGFSERVRLIANRTVSAHRDLVGDGHATGSNAGRCCRRPRCG